MSDIKQRQSTDSKQGAEGTRSLHQKGWEAMTKSNIPGSNTSGGDKKGSKEGTK
jgi:hypothetical protein